MTGKRNCIQADSNDDWGEFMYETALVLSAVYFVPATGVLIHRVSFCLFHLLTSRPLSTAFRSCFTHPDRDTA